MLPACRDYGLGVIPWSPLAGGMLGGMLGNERHRAPQERATALSGSKVRPQLEKWEKLCAELGEEPAAVALAWLLHQEGVTAPDHRAAHARAARRRVAARARHQARRRRRSALDEIFPGPGGTAPEAYAW